MNRRLLILPVVGVAALAGSQLLGGDDTELPPEPVFPTVIGDTSTEDWTDDDWSVNRFVDDPFDASLLSTGSPDQAQAGLSPEELDPEPFDPASVPATTAPSVNTPTPTPTLSPTTTTTIRDVSQAPPLADDGSGVDLPEIDDLPDDLADPGAADDLGGADPGIDAGPDDAPEA